MCTFASCPKEPNLIFVGTVDGLNKCVVRATEMHKLLGLMLLALIRLTHAGTALAYQGRSCGAQTKNLGNIILEECGIAAVNDPLCFGFFMWQPFFISWGCRCCANGTEYGKTHWNIYRYWTDTVTPSKTDSGSRSLTSSPSRSPTPLQTTSATITWSLTATASPSPTASVPPTDSLTATTTLTPSMTSSRSITKSLTCTRTVTTTLSLTATGSVTVSPSRTTTATYSRSRTRMLTLSHTMSRTSLDTPSLTATMTWTSTATSTPSQSASASQSHSATITRSLTPSHTETATSFPTDPAPSLAVDAVSGCGSSIARSALFCPAHFAALTVHGRSFGGQGATVVLRTGEGAAWPCLGTWHASATTLVCPSPRPPRSHMYSGQWWVDVEVVTLHGTGVTTPRALLITEPPTIAALVPLTEPRAGCQADGPATLTHCPRDGASFGVHGTWLMGYGPTHVTAGPYECPEVWVHNASYIECRGLVGSGVAHAVVVGLGAHDDPGLRSPRATGFTVSFLAECTGHWTGPGCSRCLPGYYGPACATLCPGRGVCSGHGTCSTGPQGTGRCDCDAGTARGFWGGAACTTCHSGFYGPNCTRRCPTADVRGTGQPLVCGGRGTCGHSTNGTGQCVCQAPFAGPACETACPADPHGATCGGHGECTAGPIASEGVCVCSANAARGRWGGAACVECAAGYAGPACRTPCPGVLQGAVPCAAHGTCSEGVQGTGECTCDEGYRGPDCATVCPGTVQGRVCAGHGHCNATGACICNRSAAAGHWGAWDCSRCVEGWAGAACTVPCPRSNTSGLVCEGRVC